MKKVLSLLIVTLIFLTACSDIKYPLSAAPAVTGSEGGEDDCAFPKENIPNKYRTRKYDLSIRTFRWEYQPEEPYFLEIGGGFFVNADITSAQHYRIWVRARGDAVIAFSAGSETFGAFYVSDDEDYVDYYIDNIYLPFGRNELIFMVLKGEAEIEGVLIEDSFSVSSERYKTTPKLTTPSPSISAQCTFDYLNTIYGSKILTGQYCTVNTNAELEAVREATGRYPAIRFGDLARYTHGYKGDKDENREIELAMEWSNCGGIVGFSWRWIIPDTALSLSYAVTDKAVHRMDKIQLVEMAEQGQIPIACVLLIDDIDEIAVQLKRLSEKDIPVLFNPIPDGGSGLYWWSGSGEDYIWLWKLVFERITYYHGLNNVIWVWSGGGYKYYPGDGFVDVIGETVYKNDIINSEVVRFGYAGGYSGSSQSRKPAAVSESGGVPVPDAIARDNSWWLFWGLYRGNFVMDEYGKPLEKTLSALDRFYNHELTVCFDELPDVKQFGIVY
ncbi:MAG: glycoside hydrolase family 26 protein [Oscillospiraceae bacterium]|nr:glycoside hydrolase family 26 protein [Oscillospiraceae bacterium]